MYYLSVPKCFSNLLTLILIATLIVLYIIYRYQIA